MTTLGLGQTLSSFVSANSFGTSLSGIISNLSSKEKMKSSERTWSLSHCPKGKLPHERSFFMLINSFGPTLSVVTGCSPEPWGCASMVSVTGATVRRGGTILLQRVLVHLGKGMGKQGERGKKEEIESVVVRRKPENASSLQPRQNESVSFCCESVDACLGGNGMMAFRHCGWRVQASKRPNKQPLTCRDRRAWSFHLRLRKPSCCWWCCW